MIPLSENAQHQLEAWLDFAQREIQSGTVDVTGWKLMEKPTLEMGKDGVITVQFAIPTDEEALPVRRSKKPPVDEETSL